MTWLQPIGEIFVIEDQKYLNKWLGTEGSQFDEADSDYDKSSEITEYIDKISVNNRPILILGDEPMQMIIRPLAKVAKGFTITHTLTTG